MEISAQLPLHGCCFAIARALGSLSPKVLALATILVLADARFGFYFCFFTLAIYLAAPIIRPTMLFLAPFLAIIALVTYAGAHWQETFDNGMAGRFLRAGDALATLDPLQVLGLRISDYLREWLFRRRGLRLRAGQDRTGGHSGILGAIHLCSSPRQRCLEIQELHRILQRFSTQHQRVAIHDKDGGSFVVPLRHVE